MHKLLQSKYDSRDYVYTLIGNQISTKVDLREWDSIVEDQGDLGSCEGNAIVNAYELLVKKESPELFVELSKLFVYYNTRLIEGTVKEDAGATIRDGLRSVKNIGICSEKLWPYTIAKFNLAPPDICYQDAAQRKLSGYKSLRTINDMLEVLNDHTPIVIGMEIFDNFMYLTQEDSVLDMPTELDHSLGGHAVSIVGYDLDTQQFLAKNSYGPDWGDLGYFWMPFPYVAKHSFERWMFTIKLQPNIILG